MSALTHRQRAERAVKVLRIPTNKTLRVGPGQWHYPETIIAREMFPRELVEAARSALSPSGHLDPGCPVGEWEEPEESCEPHSKCGRLRLALDLYPEPEEPDHEPR